MSDGIANGPERDRAGRGATRPTDIPARGWIAVLKRVRAEFRADNVTLLAAGVAFYAMLALFPAIIAVVIVYSLVADPTQVADQLGSFARSLPSGSGDLLIDQLRTAAASQSKGLTIGLAISLAAVLWSAASGVQGLIRALNTTYDERETRGYLKLRARALLLTIAAIIGTILAVGLIAALPAVLRHLGLGSVAVIVASILRWPLLALLVVLGLAVLYRYAPDRSDPRWRWVTPGAAVALVLWLLASAGFSLYVSNFGKYNQTYGALGAVIVLLLWLFLSALVVLLGAEIDAELERQTAVDTTTGPDRPMGQRDAHAADTIGD